MRVGLNALFHASGGSLTNLLQLIDEWNRGGAFLEHQWVFFVSRHTLTQIQHVLPDTVECVVFSAADRGLVTRTLVEQLLLPVRIRQQTLDVLFCPGNTMPLWTHVPCVVTFQNAAPFSPSITP